MSEFHPWHINPSSILGFFAYGYLGIFSAKYLGIWVSSLPSWVSGHLDTWIPWYLLCHPGHVAHVRRG